ncbi:Alpha/Beta hydrolase protein [Aspergillus unguis]
MASLIFYALAILGLIRCLITGLLYCKVPLTRQQKNQLAKVRQASWALSRQPLPGFEHAFLSLETGRNRGRRLHYIHNRQNVPDRNAKSLIIFIHGFPDSCLMWRHLLNQYHPDDSDIVCVDLPGYGGSDSFDSYDVSVLDALAEFCTSMRDLSKSPRVILVAHDWGCTLASRLLTEAPGVADHYVLINGLFADLAIKNFKRHIKLLPTLLSHFRPLKACRVASLLIRQVWRLAYVCTFDLPELFLGYILGVWNDAAVLRGLMHIANRRNYDFNLVEALAASLGPDVAMATSTSAGKVRYGSTILHRATSSAALLWNMTGLYRNGVLRGQWTRPEVEITEPASQAPATVIWGLSDHVMESEICLDGLADSGFLAPGSEVITLPRAGHWVPLETECIPVLCDVLQHLTETPVSSSGRSDRLDEQVLRQRYRGARIVSRT